MTQPLIIKNSQIVFAYARNLEIRKKVFEFEDLLKDHFVTPFRTVAIPNEMDPNIPRLESQSIHGYSRIQVSQNRITLATNFDENLNKAEAFEYLSRKRNMLSPLAQEESIQYFAYVIELQVNIEYDKINGILQRHTGAKALSNDCRDFSLLYSKVLKDDFYLNIKCSKFTEQKLIFNKNDQSIKPTEEFNHGISVTVDLNTKQFFETKGSFENTLYKNTEKEVFKILDNKNLEDYLKGDI